MKVRKLNENVLNEETDFGLNTTATITSKSSKTDIDSILSKTLIASKKTAPVRGDSQLNVLLTKVANNKQQLNVVLTWLNAHNANVVQLDCRTMTDTFFDETITYRQSINVLNDLNKENSVLIVNDLDRCVNSKVKTWLGKLINTHMLYDYENPSKKTFIPKFLFTITTVKEDTVSDNVPEVETQPTTNESMLTEDTIGAAAEKAANLVGAEEVISEDDSDGIIETTLDRCLKVAKRKSTQREKTFPNVLFVGEAGTGKTSRIRAWCKKNGINFYEVRCANMEDSDLGGALSPDREKGVAVRFSTSEFDKLDRPNSVLFLDEYNRARTSIRSNLLELVNSHVVPDARDPDGQRFLPNFLFTIASINPASMRYDTDELDFAERSRFGEVFVPVEPRKLLSHLRGIFNDTIQDGIDDGDKELENEARGKLKLAETILTASGFEFDSSASLDTAADDAKFNRLPLNNRTFTNLLVVCDGTKEDFLKKWNNYCNNLKKPMVQRILANYKDVDDKANDALKAGTDSKVFGKKSSSSILDAIKKQNNLN